MGSVGPQEEFPRQGRVGFSVFVGEAHSTAAPGGRGSVEACELILLFRGDGHEQPGVVTSRDKG